MSQNPETKFPDKYCDSCGQKNFRPHRSLRELFSEFVEDWLGYDSKLFQTLKALFIPARLSKDYFANSNHKNFFITPIRLYLLLSVIFFILTNFAGFSLTEIKLVDTKVVKTAPKAVEESQTVSEEDTPKQESSESNASDATANKTQEVQVEREENGTNFSITGQSQFNSKTGCKSDPNEIFNLWPQFLDDAIDEQVTDLCLEYKSILLLPEDERRPAKARFGFKLGQEVIESIPQTFFLCLPILALLLSVFYLSRKRKHIYVEHLVILMHSHSFIFAASLLYLGWFRLESYLPWLENLHMDTILPILMVVYLFLTQKWFYQRGWWATLWRFALFGFLYFILVGFVLALAALIGLLSS